ncbi:hypothetical protein Ahy_B09g096257 [Arachis hypogaea]|uniref:Uncharacterized protein n=1 Tax=Arachis hypogaea TaxID=3818 RepID=A0A444XJF2_ARAHY|nr:hypothetical protein Ahy_B09g096257 [Arachis hypogaea]
MLMEVFTRKKPTDNMFAEGFGLKNWISESKSNTIMEVIDSTLLQHDIDDILPHTSTIYLGISVELFCRFT